MAKPKILVSSTCKDLYLLREQVRGLILNFDYDPVLSEDGDIYYSPDLHIHLSCLREIQNCDMVILIIGSKFGSVFNEDASRSVTQAEHDMAYISNLPIFAFIDSKVLHDYEIYREICDDKNNKHPEILISQIPFASKADIKIFKFIESITKKIIGNSYFSFSNFGDIESILKKQWAGMVFDFLRIRKENSTNQQFINLLKQIEIANTKVEQIVDVIARNSITKPEDTDILRHISSLTNEKRLKMILFQIWECYKFLSSSLDRVKQLHKSIISEIRTIMIDEINASDTTKLLLEILQNNELIGKNNFWTFYLIDVRILELRKICKREKITIEEIDESIKFTLIQHIENLQSVQP